MSTGARVFPTEADFGEHGEYSIVATSMAESATTRHINPTESRGPRDHQLNRYLV